MKTNARPVVIWKKTYDTVTKDEGKRHEVKTVQCFLPNINVKVFLKALNVFMLILLIIAILTNKIKEAAPIMTFILEQLH
ncbi:hypothetical protein [Caproiciproducens faecalis]|uniref:Uncharacterized protein n=1 Tax=Caproiciproducens faecalis TaxID=2820301 RepID=A0ABS7DT05_9FIRM|nr:hypothetical protein [Caproiciproducens faecalis]MBW7573950.1 hypothetical protein [Caproiciproducens faecalis]